MEKKGATILLVLLLTAPAIASPGVDIRNPDIDPGNTGPTIDPHAAQGQWFNTVNDPNTGFYRPYEFYDNLYGSGGGFKSTDAIYGKVTSITYAGEGDRPNILGFSITATITNDLPGDGNWRLGSNSHTEANATVSRPEENMKDTILTGSFAIRDLMTLPSDFGLKTMPYRQRLPYFIATDEDWGGWYCWTPGSDPNSPDGGYYVPSWDFGDIAPGASSTRVLTFVVDGDGLGAKDFRYQDIEESYAADPNEGDIFLNRTTSLKISDWIDNLFLDEGTAYPTDTPLLDPEKNSNVSVFYIPEPATLSLLAIAGAALLRRRRVR